MLLLWGGVGSVVIDARGDMFYSHGGEEYGVVELCLIRFFDMFFERVPVVDEDTDLLYDR